MLEVSFVQIHSEIINEYAKLLGELDHTAKRMVFESYGVDMQGYECMIESSDYLLRCMKYRTPEKDEKDLGMHSHTDLTIISIVHQLNNLNGLEIKLKDGQWIGVDASSSLFVVIAGDAFNVSTHLYINHNLLYYLGDAFSIFISVLTSKYIKIILLRLITCILYNNFLNNLCTLILLNILIV